MSADEPFDEPQTQRARLILSLRSQGVSDPAVLAAMEQTPRDLFTPNLFQDRAWEDLRCRSPAVRRSASPTSSR